MENLVSRIPGIYRLLAESRPTEDMYADLLPRQSDPEEIRTRRMFQSIRYCSLGISSAAQRKLARAAMKEDWQGADTRLLNPPLDLISATIAKMPLEHAKGVVIVPG